MLAGMLGEYGGTDVVEVMSGSLICTVNITEVVTRLSDKGWPMDVATGEVAKLVGRIAPFDEALAYGAGRLRPVTRALGLSLGDRACLALGMATGLPVVTADRDWSKLSLGLEIRLIR
jgi:PIN domain nuclease of toxin-antitoxin system